MYFYFHCNTIKHKEMKVEVYGKNGCSYTQAALEAFKSMNIPVTYIALASNISGASIGQRTKTKATTVPVIIIDSKWIGGFNELKKIMNESWNQYQNKYADYKKSY